MRIGDKVKVELELTLSYIGNQDNPQYDFVCGNVNLEGMYSKTNGEQRQRTAFISGIPTKFIKQV